MEALFDSFLKTGSSVAIDRNKHENDLNIDVSEKYKHSIFNSEQQAAALVALPSKNYLFLEDIRLFEQRLYNLLTQGQLECMISGVRCSGKTTLMKVFVALYYKEIQAKNLFVFHFDFKLTEKFTSVYLFLQQWLETFFIMAQRQISFFETSDSDEFFGQIKKEAIKIFEDSFRAVDNACVGDLYFQLIVVIRDMARSLGFKDVLFLLDEFDKTFPILEKNDGTLPFKKSFNWAIKTFLAPETEFKNVILSGTEVIQMAIAGSNGGSHDDIDLIIKKLDNRVFSTTGLVKPETFLKTVCPDFNFPFDTYTRRVTIWEDFGGLPGYLSILAEPGEDQLTILKSKIAQGMHQDFVYFQNILHFKPHITERTGYTLESYIKLFKGDLLQLYNGDSDGLFLKIFNAHNVVTFVEKVKVDIRILHEVFLTTFRVDFLALPTRLLLGAEVNTAMLGWTIQDACLAYIKSIPPNINSNAKQLRLQHFYWGNDQMSSGMSEFEFYSTEALDYTVLSNQNELKPGCLYFDTGRADLDQHPRQSHLPGVDALLLCLLEQLSGIKRILIPAFQIKSGRILSLKSVYNTIFKFLFKRRAGYSVLTRFICLCCKEIEPSSVRVYITSQQDGIDHQEEITTNEELKESLEAPICCISFKARLKLTNQEVEGSVPIYIVVAGYFDQSVFQHYPGVHFIWGPNQLTGILGRESVDYLRRNPRFLNVSIIEDEALSRLDPNYEPKVMKILEDDHSSESRFYQLKNTPIEVILQYIAQEETLNFYEEVKVQEFEGGYTAIIKRKSPSSLPDLDGYEMEETNNANKGENAVQAVNNYNSINNNTNLNNNNNASNNVSGVNSRSRGGGPWERAENRYFEQQLSESMKDVEVQDFGSTYIPIERMKDNPKKTSSKKRRIGY